MKVTSTKTAKPNGFTTTTYLVLLETRGFKFRCTGITDDPAKNFSLPCPCVFKDEADGSTYRLDEKKNLVQVAPAYGVLCGSIARYFTTPELAKEEKKQSGGRLLLPILKRIDEIESAL